MQKDVVSPETRQPGKTPTPNPQSSESNPPSFNCPACRDGKFVHARKEDGTVDYSVAIPCRACMSEETIRRHLGVSSMQSTFNNFVPVPGSENALKAARLISGLQTEWRQLLIYGRWGNGKTHLLEAISIELWGRGISARIRTFPAFVERLKSTFDRSRGSNEDTYSDVMEAYCTMPYLLLDDVGSAGSFTDFSLSQLERIMLSRYHNDLMTVITTNLDKADLPDFVVSRFSDAVKSRMVLNEAADYRPNK